MLFEKWNEKGMRVVCEKDTVKVFEELGYKFDECPCEYQEEVVVEVQEVVETEDTTPAEIVLEDAPELDEKPKRGRKSKSQEEVVEVTEEKPSKPDIIL